MFLTRTVSYTLHNHIATTIPKPVQDKNTEQLLYNTNLTSDKLIFLATSTCSIIWVLSFIMTKQNLDLQKLFKWEHFCDNCFALQETLQAKSITGI